MATSVAFIGGGACGSTWIRSKNSKKKALRNNDTVQVFCVSSAAGRDPYKTLRVKPEASKSEVKKAFRRLALRYHPDICRGNHCTVQFQRINEAYDMVMSSLRGELTLPETMKAYESSNAGGMNDQKSVVVDDSDWDTEEWMGFEGAWVPDYSALINADV